MLTPDSEPMIIRLTEGDKRKLKHLVPTGERPLALVVLVAVSG